MSAGTNGGGVPSPVYTSVIEHISTAAPELNPRHAYIGVRHYVVVDVNDEYAARFTVNGVMWCARVATRDEIGRDVTESMENLGTNLSYLCEDAATIGDAIIGAVAERRAEKFRHSNEVDFKTLVAAAINDGDPTLEAELYQATPGIYSVHVRLRANKAGIFGDVDCTWGGQVVTLTTDGEWQYEEDEDDLFALTGAPEINYYETIPAGTAQLVASEILSAARAYREEHDEPEGTFKEFLLLVEPVRNPDTSAGEFHVWRAVEVFERGARFVISRERGREPRLYPVGGFEMQYVWPGNPVYAALRPHLQDSAATVGELILEEKRDPVAVIEKLIASGVVSRETVIEKMREPEAHAEEE